MGIRLCYIFVLLGLLSHTAFAASTRGSNSGVGMVVDIVPAKYDARVEGKLAMLQGKLTSAKTESSKKRVARQIEETKSNWIQSGDKEILLIFGDDSGTSIYPMELGIGRKQLRMEPGKFYEMTAEYQLDRNHRGQTFRSLADAMRETRVFVDGRWKENPLKISRYKEAVIPVWWDSAKIRLSSWGKPWIPNLDPNDTYIEAGDVQMGEVSVRYSGGNQIQTAFGTHGHPPSSRVVQLYSVPFINGSIRVIENASIHCVLKDQNGKVRGRSQEGGQFTSWKPGEVRVIKFELGTESIPGLQSDHKVVRLTFAASNPETSRPPRKKPDAKKLLPIKHTKIQDEHSQLKRLATFELNQRLNLDQLQQVADDLVQASNTTAEQTFLSFTLSGTQYSLEKSWATAIYNGDRLDSIEIHGLSAEQANMLIGLPKPKGQVIGQWFWGHTMRCMVSIVRRGASWEMILTPGWGTTAGQHRPFQALGRRSGRTTMEFTQLPPTELQERYVRAASGNLEFYDVDGKHLELEPIGAIPNWQPPVVR